MKKPELLAPAGDMACLRAAVNAGADAVYLGGEEYGARAYASNFSTEELCEAVSYAHLFDVKIYLTVNTLVKERELHRLTDFLLPVYEAGLDGVIVQDFGVLKRIKEVFPDLKLHGSTQMCVANVYGAELLKQYGVSRIVPARELSLQELIEIKKQTGMEIECFVHGAMCYCYSGQCLFSSFLGGRSGNRGRCAGPCRLPYEAFGQKENYPLSLKDMCTIHILGELMDSGMDSLKIEGRMKNPLYVAGVTAVYRKYIDRYAKADSAGAPVNIEKEDLKTLQNLYIRTGLQDGYFHRHNGKEMLTLKKPGYSSAPDEMFSDIKEAYLDHDKKIPVEGELTVRKGSPLRLKISDDKGHEVTVFGEELAAEALKRPVLSDDIKRQMFKTGNTAFYFETFSVIMDDNVFISLIALNELRRKALLKLEAEIPADRRRRFCNDVPQKLTISSSPVNTNTKAFRIFCRTKAQLLCVADFINGYMDFEGINGVEINAFLLKDLDDRLLRKLYAVKEKGIGIYLVLPSVFRRKTSDWTANYEDVVFSELFDGYYCNGLDALFYIRTHNRETDKQIMADHALYICNHEAAKFLREQGAHGFVVPYELSYHEWTDLKISMSEDITEPLLQEYTVYGHAPFMQTANCIKKSFGRCDQTDEVITIRDRMGKNIYIATQCEACENTVYNGVVLSLHHEKDMISADVLRICFTMESPEEAIRVLHLFLDGRDAPFFEYTKGHFKKGIE